jgi:two-component system chemotaxis sensor kinase CheA
VVIELSDDGRGLAREPILRKARERGLVHPDEQLSDAQVHELIFAPGFSTASNVTELSGRGVGMDVVKRNVEAMRGRVQLHSEQGKGTTFRLVLPMTLAVIDGLLVSCGPERFILPALGVFETVQVSPSRLHLLGTRGEYVDVRGELLPLHRLDRLFEVEGALQDPLEALILVVESAGRRITLMVDEILAQQQVVTRPLAGVGRVPHFSGAAILADGRAGLIVNLDGLTDAPRHEVFA